MDSININSEDISELRTTLINELNIQLSEEQLNAIIKKWNSWFSHREKVQARNLDEKRNQLDKIIAGLKEGLLSLYKLKNFDLLSFNPIAKSRDQTEAIALMMNEIKLAETTRLLVFNRGIQNPEWFKLVAMIELFMTADELGLKPLEKVGRGNKDPLKYFVVLITGLQDPAEIYRYYSKYKKWKAGEISLI